MEAMGAKKRRLRGGMRESIITIDEIFANTFCMQEETVSRPKNVKPLAGWEGAGNGDGAGVGALDGAGIRDSPRPPAMREHLL